MANPQAENGHLRIATEIVKQLARLNLPSYEWRVLWAILLKTWAWRKKYDSVPVSQLTMLTGLRQPHASRAKASLLKKRVLFEQAGKIGFQKNYEVWAIEGFTYTNSGIKTAPNHTNSGMSHTNSGMKSIPIQVLSKKKKDTTQKKESKTFPESFVAYWNSKANLPQVRRMTDERKEKLGARLEEEDFANHWQEVNDKISQSVFCTGHNDRGWKASIDWVLVNSTNYVKVLEGKYEDSPREEPKRGDPDWLPTEEEAEKLMAEVQA